MPAVSWSTTYFPLQQYGLKLKFVDVDLHTLNYNLSDLESAISENTKALMVVNLLGNNNDFDKINSIINKNIVMIEIIRIYGSNLQRKVCGHIWINGYI